ncbi:Hypothetical predicted protein [Marmota monax]|uniref:Uncharacterized protein n=1 Tax=Marmota monax TaxID=9995 RepID=A0A5E4BKH8_MARMO|nr:hypothetical protein GHT09_005334 [Marmota monax]VTJ69895.1 Hypothetical predicted protein [Marmota monax]
MRPVHPAAAAQTAPFCSLTPEPPEACHHDLPNPTLGQPRLSASLHQLEAAPWSSLWRIPATSLLPGPRGSPQPLGTQGLPSLLRKPQSAGRRATAHPSGSPPTVATGSRLPWLLRFVLLFLSACRPEPQLSPASCLSFRA